MYNMSKCNDVEDLVALYRLFTCRVFFFLFFILGAQYLKCHSKFEETVSM